MAVAAIAAAVAGAVALAASEAAAGAVALAVSEASAAWRTASAPPPRQRGRSEGERQPPQQLSERWTRVCRTSRASASPWGRGAGRCAAIA
eukprot:6693638-Prymnesium_polylepis.1